MLIGKRLHKRFEKEFLQRLRNNDEDLTELDLMNKEIGDEGIIELAEYLTDNRTVRYLNLYANEIGDESAFALAKLLRKNNTLTRLDLSLNDIGSAGAKAIFKALECNETLSIIDCGMPVGNGAVKALGKMLVKNTTLAYLSFEFFEVEEDGKTAFAKGLGQNRGLASIKLIITPHQDNIHESLIEMLSEALLQNSTLTSLSFLDVHDAEETMVSDKAQKAFADAVKNNYILEDFDTETSSCFPTFLADDAYVCIMESVARNRALRQEVELVACQMLRAARLTNLEIGYQVGEVVVKLPMELQLRIISHVDAKDVLTNQQKEKILNFALDRRTLGKLQIEFIRQANCLQYDKYKAEEDRTNYEPPNKKIKPG